MVLCTATPMTFGVFVSPTESHYWRSARLYKTERAPPDAMRLRKHGKPASEKDPCSVPLLDMSPNDEKAENSVWYFAYGSNMKSSVMKQRGIRPQAARKVVVPSHMLTFDVFGVPYSEPAMASIAPRPVDATGRCTAPPVHGIAYLLSRAEFHSLAVSEGAGIAYVEVQLDAQLLPPALAGNTTTTAQPRLPVRTLSARFPFRPNPRPSARYLAGPRSH